jgi:hypothetical protein
MQVYLSVLQYAVLILHALLYTELLTMIRALF